MMCWCFMEITLGWWSSWAARSHRQLQPAAESSSEPLKHSSAPLTWTAPFYHFLTAPCCQCHFKPHPLQISRTHHSPPTSQMEQLQIIQHNPSTVLCCCAAVLAVPLKEENGELLKEEAKVKCFLRGSLCPIHHFIRFVRCILVYTPVLWQLKMGDISV